LVFGFWFWVFEFEAGLLDQQSYERASIWGNMQCQSAGGEIRKDKGETARDVAINPKRMCQAAGEFSNTKKTKKNRQKCLKCSFDTVSILQPHNLFDHAFPRRLLTEAHELPLQIAIAPRRQKRNSQCGKLELVK